MIFHINGDVSARLVRILRRYTPDVEAYSIDESFLRFEGDPDRLTVEARHIRETIRRWARIPVSIGIAATKTLAKLATRTAKRDKACNGVCNLFCASNLDDVLDAVPVGDVWGVGRRRAAMLKAHDLTTARLFRDMRDDWVRANVSVTGLRTCLELRGIPCFTVETQPKPRRMMASTRSFGRDVTLLDHLRQAAAYHATRVAERLRRQGSTASALHLFLRTKRVLGIPVRHDATTLDLRFPTAYTPDLVEAAVECLDKVFSEGRTYRKLGVMLFGVVPCPPEQQNLFFGLPQTRHKAAMNVIDALNERFGSGTIRTAREGYERPWELRAERRSPRWTTRWDELPTVK